MHRLAWTCFLIWFTLQSVFGQSEGIFADFSTSKGDFTVWLDYSNAPRAVASFVGLATGEGGWADPQGNVWHKPFYDGTIFHRIATNGAGDRLAIQGGGIPACAIALASIPDGPAVSSSGSFSLQTTNAPGVTTNLFGPIAFEVNNIAAVPTNFSYGSETVQTNALAVTRTAIYWSARSTGTTVNVLGSDTTQTWFTNHAVEAVTTTHYRTAFTVTTNLDAAPQILTHFIQVSMASTSTLLGPVVSTNFSNAGYYLLDSATNGLVHSNGVISMANSGPNTDSSQFFITATNVPGWNGSYTVFGHVTTGMNVVTSIAAVAVQGAGPRPVQDVVLRHVGIRRVGSAAVNFNIAAQGLPVVASAPIPRMVATGNLARIEVEIPPYSEILFRVSTNGLQTWQTEDWGYQTNGTPRLREVSRDVRRSAFFHALCVQYFDAWTAPANYRGRVFSFVWNTDPPTRYTVAFTNPAHIGDFSRSQGTNFLAGQLLGGPYAPGWTHFPYSAKLYFTDDSFGGGQFSYLLWFDPGKATNRFTGTCWPWMGTPFIFSGVFTFH